MNSEPVEKGLRKGGVGAVIGFAGNPCPSAPCSQVLQVQCHQRSPKAPGQAHCCLLTEEGGPVGHKRPWLLGQ